MDRHLFYKSDNELSSPFKHPTTQTNKVVKKKSTNNKIWDLSTLMKQHFINEFQHDNTNIKLTDYKWQLAPHQTIDISLQPWRTNLPEAIDIALLQYKGEIDANLPSHDTHNIHKLKTNLNKDILKQINKKLGQCQLPQNTNVQNDLDPEYIFAKRQYLQSMINQTSNDIHILKQQLLKEETQLKDAKSFINTLNNQNNQLIKQNLLNETLHPLMNKIIQNEFGLIKDTPSNNDKGNQDKDDDVDNTIKYNGPMRRNKAKYNLIPVIASPQDDDANDEYEILNQSLPSLNKLNQFTPSMNQHIDNIITMDKTKQLFK